MRISALLQKLGSGFLAGRRQRRKSRAFTPTSGEMLEMRQLLTAQVTQMGDLNLVTETGGSDPQELTQVGGTLFFTAVDKTHGRELWKKEGTNAAVLVKDIFVGTDSSVPVELTAVGTTLFFSANNGINGRELWKSDGTPAGTVLVKDIWGNEGDSSTRSYDSNPHLLTSAGGKLFYVAHVINENISGIVHSLVVSDGTAAGTGIVNSSIGDVWTGSDARLTAVGSEVYFRAWSAGNVSGTELWKSDGTTAGTVQVSDIWPGGGVSHVEDITPVGSMTYFTAWHSNGLNGSHNRELWKTDGTAAGTVLVKDINTTSVDASSDPLNLTNVNSTLFFTADDGVNGRELWKSDGTAAGTTMVKEILVSPSGSSPGNLIAVASTLYFSASDGVTGDELWKSDGTSAGTVRVGHSGTSANFTPRNLTNIGGSLYFSAFTFETGFEVWKSDGTTAGTNVYKDLVAGAGGSGPTQFTNLNGVLYYTANDGVKGNELWRHDVTTNTATVNDVFRGTLNSSARHFTAVGSNVFFIANNGINGEELWKCALNGTGATMVKDIHPGVNSGEISQLTNVNGLLYFSARNNDSGLEVWRSDGTTGGTVILKEIGAAGASSYPSGLTNLNGTLIFSAQDANGHELWKSDGTAAGTVMVKNIATGAASSINRLYNSFVVIGSTAFFKASDGVNGEELWNTDGSSAGTVLVKDIRTGTNGSLLNKLTNVDGLLYFIADNGADGIELWQSNGTAAGTTMVADLNIQNIDQLTNVAGKLFFTANGELWSRNTPTATPTLLREIGEGNWDGDPLSLTAVGSTLFFTAVFATQTPRVGLGRELWRSDGTTAGTVLVKDIVNIPVAGHTPSVWGSNPLNLVNNNGTLFFTANNLLNGQELWMSDGTEAGTVMFADLSNDAGSSHPENLTAINGRIFGSAMSEATGREAFSVIDVVVPAAPTITVPGATTPLQRPTIAWTVSNGAVSYDVFIKNNATGANPQVSVNVSGTSYVPAADLGIGKFSVWVRAVNAAGTKSAWSLVKNFTVNTSVTNAPIIRNQTTSRPTVVWKDLPGAVKYDVWLENATPNETSTVILHDIKGKSWQHTADLPLGQYKVYVRGLDASGLAAGWSPLIAFNVATPPTVIGPVNSTFDARPQFSWNSVPGATRYDVYLRNLNTETVVVNQTNITATNWTPASNLPNGHYRWQIVAASANYRGLWSKEVDFSVGGRPEITAPAASGTDTTPTFTWKAVSGAATYQIWVDRADTYVQGIINVSGLTGTSYTPTTALPLGTYRVWIRAVSSTGVLSDWSEHRAFAITT